MYNSYLNIALFLFTTLFYYLALKPSLTLNIMQTPDLFKKYEMDHYLYLAIYLLLITIIQFAVNAYLITSSCGGSVTENLGSAALFSFLPWILIFGVMILILVIFPGFKSAFSDVVGYYFVSSSANKLLVNLLVDQDVEKQMDNANATPKQREAMQQAADTILKICGNSSILINQIVPSNFLKNWQILIPLMKERYKNIYERTPITINPNPAPNPNPVSNPNPIYKGGAAADNIQEQFFDLVVTRDNVGEAMWYIYTGILLTSIVQLKIANAGCKNSPAVMQQNYQAYLKQQEAVDAKQKQATSTVYTLAS